MRANRGQSGLARRVYRGAAVNEPSRAARLTTVSVALLLGTGALGVGCHRPQKPRGYELIVHVESDPERPLSGAKLLHAGRPLGVSGADGRVPILANGSEGERLELEVACPAGFRSPELPLVVTLRRASGHAEKPEYFASCPPLTRKLVVAARLEHGENLPIRYLGRELARSDASGVAHLLLEAETAETVELTVDTSERPRLRPKSPTARFRIGDRDDIVVFTQSFQSVQHAAGPRRSSGPVRIR